MTEFSANAKKSLTGICAIALIAATEACGSSEPSHESSETGAPTSDAGSDAGDGTDGASSDVATPAAAYRICNGSTGLRFAHQLMGGGQVQPGNEPVVQNGHFFLFVSGSCEFYVYGRFNGEGTPLVPVRQGRLTDSELAELESISQVSAWVAHESTVGRFDGPDVIFWSGQAKMVLKSMPFAKSSSDAATLIGLSKDIQTWAARLYREGQDLDGPIRLTVLRFSKGDTGSVTKGRIQWPLGISLGSSASDPNVPPLKDPAFISNDPGMPALRKARATALDPAFQETKGIWNDLLVDEGPYTYRIHFRDVIPFEDQNGLVQFD